MLRIGSTVLGAENVRRATEFWTRALGYIPRDPDLDDRFVVLRAPDDSGQNLSIMLSETPVQERPRVHLDLYSETPDEEIERLLALGATRVDWTDYPPDADFTVLADTEGNRFCVIDTRA